MPTNLKITESYGLSRSPFAQTFAELPAALAIFPLSGAVVMPTSYLPLNIFEPRYLNMVTDAMRGDQLIGMVQPLTRRAVGDESEIHLVGTCGRIVQYEETTDGRMNIVLNGLCRFRIDNEIATTRGYKMVSPDWSSFAEDFETAAPRAQAEYDQLKLLIKRYIDDNDFDPKWKEVVDNAEPCQLISNAISYLPFSPQDKQFLVETVAFDDLLSATIAVMQTQGAGDTKH